MEKHLGMSDIERNRLKRWIKYYHIGLPKKVDELESRIKSFENFNTKNKLIMTIVGLCAELSITEREFYLWCRGYTPKNLSSKESERWQEICVSERNKIIERWDRQYKERKMRKVVYQYLKDRYSYCIEDSPTRTVG